MEIQNKTNKKKYSISALMKFLSVDDLMEQWSLASTTAQTRTQHLPPPTHHSLLLPHLFALSHPYTSFPLIPSLHGLSYDVVVALQYLTEELLRHFSVWCQVAMLRLIFGTLRSGHYVFVCHGESLQCFGEFKLRDGEFIALHCSPCFRLRCLVMLREVME